MLRNSRTHISLSPVFFILTFCIFSLSAEASIDTKHYEQIQVLESKLELLSSQLVSTRNTDAHQQVVNVSTSTPNFIFKLPRGWKKKLEIDEKGTPHVLLFSKDYKKTSTQNDKGSDLVFSGDMVDIGYQGSWTANNTQQTPDKYVAAKMKHYGQYPDNVVQKEIFLGSNPAHQRRNTIEGAQITTIYTLHEQKEFVVRYIPNKGTWGRKQEKILHNIVRSFKFTK